MSLDSAAKVGRVGASALVIKRRVLPMKLCIADAAGDINGLLAVYSTPIWVCSWVELAGIQSVPVKYWHRDMVSRYRRSTSIVANI